MHVALVTLAIGCSDDPVEVADTGDTSNGPTGPETTSTGMSTSTSSTDATTTDATTTEGTTTEGTTTESTTLDDTTTESTTTEDTTTESTTTESTTTESTTTDDTTTESTATTGAVDTCRDGVLDEGEECDDGDEVDENECTNECTLPTWILWTIGYDGPDGGNDAPYDVAVDSNDDIIVVGTIVMAEAHEDAVTRKYDANGALIWERTYVGIGDSNEDAASVAVDDANNVYVAGSITIGAETAIWLRKYDAAGDELWTREYSGPLNSSSAAEVAVDQAGDVVVVGVDASLGGDLDALIRRYSSDGDVLWTLDEDVGAGLHDRALGVHINDADEIVVGGDIVQVAGWARSFDADGALLWSQDALPDMGGCYAVSGTATDPVYLAGVNWSHQGHIHRLDDGEVTWSENGGPAEDFSYFGAVTVDSNGAAIAAGYQNNAEMNQAVMRKYDSNGDEVWVRYYNAGSMYLETASGVAVDSQDNVIAVGSTYVGLNEDWWIRKMTP